MGSKKNHVLDWHRGVENAIASLKWALDFGIPKGEQHDEVAEALDILQEVER